MRPSEYESEQEQEVVSQSQSVRIISCNILLGDTVYVVMHMVQFQQSFYCEFAPIVIVYF